MFDNKNTAPGQCSAGPKSTPTTKADDVREAQEKNMLDSEAEAILVAITGKYNEMQQNYFISTIVERLICIRSEQADRLRRQSSDINTSIDDLMKRLK